VNASEDVAIDISRCQCKIIYMHCSLMSEVCGSESKNGKCIGILRPLPLDSMSEIMGYYVCNTVRKLVPGPLVYGPCSSYIDP